LYVSSYTLGDYLLCIIQPIQTQQDTKSVAKTEKKRHNSHILNCYSLHPKSPDPWNAWVISQHFQLSCQMAQPIHVAPISPPQYNIDNLASCIENPSIPHGRFPNKTIPWWIIQPFNPPLARDILVCRYTETEQRYTSLSVFRSHFHWVDCKLPQSTSISSSSLENGLDIYSLRHAVLDRVDLLYIQEGHIDSVRISIHLRMISSPITEAALLTVGSALSGRVIPCSFGNTIFHIPEFTMTGVYPSLMLNPSIDTNGTSFTLRLRSEIVRIAQQIAMNASIMPSSDSWDDLEWFTFSQIVMQFFGLMNSISTPDTHDQSKDQAWDDLLQSEYHQRYHDKKRLFHLPELKRSNGIHMHGSWSHFFQDVKLLTTGRRENKTTFLCTIIFDSLHMFYEDCKVSKGWRDGVWIRKLGSLLYTLSSMETSVTNEYIDHYRNDLDRYCVDSINSLSSSNIQIQSIFIHPPCYFSWLESLIKKQEYDIGMKLLNGTCTSMRVLLSSYLTLFSLAENHSKYYSIIHSLSSEGIKSISSLIEIFTPGASLPILDALQRCRINPPLPSATNSWSVDCYNLIERPDLGKIQSSLSDECHNHCYTTHNAAKVIEDVDRDGLSFVESYSSMIFPNDTRVNEAARLLRSSRPSFLHVERSSEVSDHAFEKLKQEKLLLLCRRKLALALGRGMLTFGTVQPNRTEPITVPKISLAGRTSPNNSTLTLDVSSQPDISIWPDFHNGVAAGLRLHSVHRHHHSSSINRAWIISNKPTKSTGNPPEPVGDRSNNTMNAAQNNHFHGGFLMALGLNGHLSALNTTDIYEYLTQGVVTTTVGILLGMAANKMGTCDPSVSKVLCLHIPSLLPPTFATIEVASPVQIAAISGIGLLYQKSRHRLMTEFLLKELGKRPTNIPSDRESYSLSCGLALGMINLSLGEENDTGISDLHIEERLHRYIIGGRVENESHYDIDNPDRLPQTGSGNENERTSLILEGDAINIDVTAPGAILALGLIYIRSGYVLLILLSLLFSLPQSIT